MKKVSKGGKNLYRFWNVEKVFSKNNTLKVEKKEKVLKRWKSIL